MTIKGLSVPNLASALSGNESGRTATNASEKKTNDLWGADRFEKTPVSETLQASCRPVSAGAALLINMLVVCPSNGSMTGKWKRPSGIRPQNPSVEKLVRGLV